jgi:Flp pilus assembly protein TadG
VSARRGKRQRGQAMVESALTFLVMISMIIAIMDFGQLLYMHATLTERVRSAARYASIAPTATTAIQNVAIYNSTNPTSSDKALLPGLTASMVAVTRANVGTASETVTVTISGYPVVMLTPGIAQAFNARAFSATMPSEAQ